MTLRPDTRVEDAWRQLVARGLGLAPVLDKTLRLVGLVSVQDLLMVINVEGDKVRDILSRSVADVMTSPVVSAGPITAISVAWRACCSTINCLGCRWSTSGKSWSASSAAATSCVPWSTTRP